jgi:hypothetical protein
MRLVLNSVDVGNNESTLQTQTIDIYKQERKTQARHQGLDHLLLFRIGFKRWV